MHVLAVKYTLYLSFPGFFFLLELYDFLIVTYQAHYFKLIGRSKICFRLWIQSARKRFYLPFRVHLPYCLVVSLRYGSVCLCTLTHRS